MVDRINTNQPRTISTLWHWHPEADVKQYGDATVGSYPEGSLEIVPVGDASFDIQMIKGQENPEIQGWYSPEYNLYEANVASIYNSEIKDTTTFVWLLIPSKGNAERQISRAKIIRENQNAIELEVYHNGKNYELSIPFEDNSFVKFNKNKGFVDPYFSTKYFQ